MNTKLQPASQFLTIEEVACVQLFVKCLQLHTFCWIDSIMNFRNRIVLVHFDNSVEFQGHRTNGMSTAAIRIEEENIAKYKNAILGFY